MHIGPADWVHRRDAAGRRACDYPNATGADFANFAWPPDSSVPSVRPRHASTDQDSSSQRPEAGAVKSPAAPQTGSSSSRHLDWTKAPVACVYCTDDLKTCEVRPTQEAHPEKCRRCRSKYIECSFVPYLAQPSAPAATADEQPGGASTRKAKRIHLSHRFESLPEVDAAAMRSTTRRSAAAAATEVAGPSHPLGSASAPTAAAMHFATATTSDAMISTLDLSASVAHLPLAASSARVPHVLISAPSALRRVGRGNLHHDVHMHDVDLGRSSHAPSKRAAAAAAAAAASAHGTMPAATATAVPVVRSHRKRSAPSDHGDDLADAELVSPQMRTRLTSSRT